MLYEQVCLINTRSEPILTLHSSYNKLNGLHCSENPKLLKEILKGEWQSDAMVMSDWFGVYGLSESINATLDLEMPGTDKWRTVDKVGRSIRAYKTSLRTVKERAYKVLELVQKLCKTNAEVRLCHSPNRTSIECNCAGH